MKLLNLDALRKFRGRHRDAAAWLDNWAETVEQAEWSSLADVRRSFPSADGVPVKTAGVVIIVTVFNVKGNAYRLLTAVDYAGERVTVIDCLTHAEYDRDAWKDRL